MPSRRMLGASSRDRIVEFSTPEPNTGCWLWDGAVSTSGYGSMWASGRTRTASRVSYEEFVGPIPNGQQVLHKCDVRSCVNPDHLFIGSHNDNMRDKVLKGRGNYARGDQSGRRKHPDRYPVGDAHYSRTNPERMARGDRHRSRTSPHTLARGERTGTSKLTDNDVREIRARWASGETFAQIARSYGVTAANISYVARGVTWRHIVLAITH